jgi:hypothetical protein
MTLVAFLRGATALGCLVAGLFFLRFWRTTTDRLFWWFALAFMILAIDFTVLGLVPLATEWRVYVYGVRLLAFCLILYGIIEKNRPAK